MNWHVCVELRSVVFKKCQLLSLSSTNCSLDECICPGIDIRSIVQEFRVTLIVAFCSVAVWSSCYIHRQNGVVSPLCPGLEISSSLSNKRWVGILKQFTQDPVGEICCCCCCQQWWMKKSILSVGELL